MLVQREMVAGAGDTDARCHRVRGTCLKMAAVELCMQGVM